MGPQDSHIIPAANRVYVENIGNWSIERGDRESNGLWRSYYRTVLDRIRATSIMIASNHSAQNLRPNHQKEGIIRMVVEHRGSGRSLGGVAVRR